jgi:hypothetical protein
MIETWLVVTSFVPEQATPNFFVTQTLLTHRRKKSLAAH